MGEPNQEALKAPDLDIEAKQIFRASFIEHHKYSADKLLLYCLCLFVSNSKESTATKGSRLKQSNLIGQLANARTLDMYHTTECREHRS